MKQFSHNADLVPLSLDESIIINGGEEGKAYHDLARAISYAIHYIEGAWDQFVEDVEDFFDGVQGGWENTRN